MPVLDPEQLLEGLDPEQREVATAVAGPVCVLAGAGTGKTRAITHRIAYGAHAGAFDPGRVLAVTFTTRAAGEMRTRLRTLGVPSVQARTFHSAALRQLRYFWPQVYGGALPTLVESKLGLLAEAARRCRLQTDQVTLKDFASEVEWAKVTNVRPDDYAKVAPARGRELAGHDPETAARVIAVYEEVKRERGRIDMEDVLLLTAAMLDGDDRVAAQVRSQYRTFVVDEYQDVSPIQQTLLDLWLGERSDVCVVGDPDQTIYAFAGASADSLLRFRRRYPGAHVARLLRNYRSTPQVIEVANRLLARAPASAAPARLPLRAQRPAGPAASFDEYPDEVAEAEAVAARIAELRESGVALRDIAVLFRIHAQSETVEQELAARSIPYVVRGGERFFERQEVRQAIALLRGARAQQATAADGRDDTTEDRPGLVEQVTAVLAGMGWSPDPPSGAGNVRSRWESLDALRALAADLATGSGTDSTLRPDSPLLPDSTDGTHGTVAPTAPGLDAFVTELQRRANAQHAPVADGVTLATMHAAKGLEWAAVFVTGVQEGSMPITYAETPAEIAEERRLLYVAVTRARDRLSVSWSKARTPGGRAGRRPSRFLEGVRPKGATDPEASAAGPRRRRTRSVARCRVCSAPLHDAVERKLGRCATCPSDYDEELFERLRAWRTSRAAEEKVPAYVVFTDATLTAIAEVRPSDPQQLLRIPGIGQVKLDKYAEAVLKICAGD